jgi:hypothetical protein
MKCSVWRLEPTARSTPGLLEINGVHQCYTLEKLPAFHGQTNVPEKTCIPAGTYPLVLQWSPRHQCTKPWVMNVPNRSDIQIDVANTADELLGCVAVGQTRGIDWVDQSQLAFDALMRILKGIGTEPVTITFVDPLRTPATDPDLGS